MSNNLIKLQCENCGSDLRPDSSSGLFISGENSILKCNSCDTFYILKGNRLSKYVKPELNKSTNASSYGYNHNTRSSYFVTSYSPYTVLETGEWIIQVHREPQPPYNIQIIVRYKNYAAKDYLDMDLIRDPGMSSVYSFSAANINQRMQRNLKDTIEKLVLRIKRANPQEFDNLDFDPEEIIPAFERMVKESTYIRRML